MKVTYLIGNGLDINLGLKTSYSDFYQYLISKKNLDPKNDIYNAILNKGMDLYEPLEKIDWSDFEIGIGKYTRIAKAKNNLEKFENDFEELVEEFTQFIEEQTNEIDFDSFLPSATKVFNQAIIKPYNLEEQDQEKIVKEYKNYSAEHKIRDLIVFNYTEILDKIYQSWESSTGKTNIKVNRPIHIHGYCHSEMLLGVNDVTQISEEYAENEDIKAMMVKTYANELSTTIRFRKTQEIINSSDMYIIYGMSIGDSDKFWWELIVENLEKSERKKVVIYAYDKIKLTLDKRINKMNSKKREWRKKLTAHSKTENKEYLYSQIFVQFNTEKIFDFKKIPLKEKEYSSK